LKTAVPGVAAEPTSAAAFASEPQSIGSALAFAKAAGVDRLDAQWLLAQMFGQARVWLLAHPDERLSAAQAERFVSALQARRQGLPLAYVLGQWSFAGLSLEVNPAVLVPRPETEELLRWALHRAQAKTAPRLLDLGTGSGALALAMKSALPQAEVWATDAHEAALEVARSNALRLGLSVHFTGAGSWWQALPHDIGRFDIVVSNPPYIAVDDPHLAALGHEPRHALVADDGGLADLRLIIDGAPAHLQAGAWLLLEHGHEQHTGVAAMLAQRGFVAIEGRQDLAGLPRCTAACWPGDKA
jgi:release factor glutamine methyltransferase